MSTENDNSVDILGIKPVAKCIETTTEKTVDGAYSFLGKICMPAAEEFGLMLQDKVKSWRATNAQKTLDKAEALLSRDGQIENKKAHPLIAWRIIENSSWTEHDELQNMWAGLLSSTCTEDGKDDSNLVFLNLISQLSEVQIRILNYAVENAELKLNEFDFVTAKELKVDMDVIKQVTKLDDTHRIDRELDHLSSIDLIGDTLSGGGIMLDLGGKVTSVVITPRPIVIQLYVRCQGYIGPAKEYFGL